MWRFREIVLPNATDIDAVSQPEGNTPLYALLQSEAGVAAYLRQRGAGAEVPAKLVRVLTQRTDGHPLFLVAVVLGSACLAVPGLAVWMFAGAVLRWPG